MKRIDIPDFFDKKIMEGFHGRNYIASMQEIIMRNVTEKSFLEIFLMSPNIKVPTNIESYYEDIFKKFKQTQDIRLLTNCNIDFNKKDGVESDFYKSRILELLKETERLDLMPRLPIDWNKGDDDNPNKYKDFISNEYNPNEIFVISTDLNRTIMSAYSNLLGTFYNSTKTKKMEIDDKFILNKNYSEKIKNTSYEFKNDVFPVHFFKEKDLSYQLYRTEICPGFETFLNKITI